MTTTNIYNGLAEGRASSRVLRPPGGGHTDVLGLGADPAPQQAKKVTHRNFSSIIEGTNEIIAPVGKPSAPPQEEKPAPVVTHVAEPASVQAAPEPQAQTTPSPVQTAPAPAQAVAPPSVQQAPQRTRVPPGGFSSGLW